MSDTQAFGHSDKIPEAKRDICTHLCQEVAMLTHKWNTYLELFGDAQRAGMLVDAANAFFQTIEESLRIDMCMAISRMSDKKRVGGYDTISFDRLRVLCADVPRINELVDEFEQWCEDVRKYRHKLLAHNELDIITKPSDKPLFPITRALIEGAISRAQGILNAVYDHYAQIELGFDVHHIGGAKHLICLLKIASNHIDDLRPPT
jgi:hypothetical protein